ncbi:LysR substrate-binding domain-containing protein [Marinimicrobium alkaliphilum]|uniref:LysR substrate-binding domain-containing protein n=1 Tax=Marinimicrobium alkaliphilum TaxID=2202654 RepID=UPI000DB93B5A|nr:LysR substrate-binding domain-containing protein [Marinimicrobium alkaliphilum]
MANWEGINEFAAVADAGSFTEAARRLGTSVANVSRRVSTLEARLDAKLLQRTTRRVSLTEEGRIYHRHCRQVLENLEEAERAVSRLHTQPVGQLRLTAPLSYGERYIAPLVNEFAQQHPALNIELKLNNQKLDLIDEGLDLAIRLGVLEDSRLVARKLSSRAQYVCAAPAYLARHGQPHTLSELDQHNCLLGTLDYWRFMEKGKTRTIRVKGSLRCNSGPALVDAALKGIGLVQLPDYYVGRPIEQGELVPLLTQYPPMSEGIWALYPTNRHLSSKVRLLIEFLAERLPVMA